jgi:hypothetical protein
MLLFVRALARTRKRWAFAASSRALPNIQFNRTATALRASAAGYQHVVRLRVKEHARYIEHR